jgi:hypothetical protein
VVAKSRHGVGRAEGDGAQHEAPVLERHTTRFRAGRQPGPLTAPVLGRSGCPTERAGRSQGRPLFQRGDVCCMQQQTGEFCAAHFFDTGSAAAVGRQGRWTQLSFVWLATGSGRWKVENFDSNGCVHRARAAGRRRRCIAGCAELRAGEATYARGRKCENALELRGRASAEFPGQAMHGALSSSRCP